MRLSVQSLYPEPKPQWELQWSSWLYWWLCSASMLQVLLQIHLDYVCVVENSVFRQPPAFIVNCSQCMEVKDAMVFDTWRMARHFSVTEGCSWYSAVVLATSSMDTEATAVCQDAGLETLRYVLVRTPFHEHIAWTFLFNEFVLLSMDASKILAPQSPVSVQVYSSFVQLQWLIDYQEVWHKLGMKLHNFLPFWQVLAAPVQGRSPTVWAAWMRTDPGPCSAVIVVLSYMVPQCFTVRDTLGMVQSLSAKVSLKNSP